MAEETFNPLVWLMDVVADAVDWIHETFSDRALSEELRRDLGIEDKGTPQGQLPSGEKIRMRHPNGDPVDVDKDAFDATVAEVRAAFGLLADFFSTLDLSVDEVWDVIAMAAQVGASESVRARSPETHALLRALGLLGGLGSTEDVEAIDVLRAVNLLGGHSGVPSDLVDPTAAEGVRNWIAFASAILLAIYGDNLPALVQASYGYEHDPGASPKVSEAVRIAQTAYTLHAADPDPANVGGHLDLSVVWVPPATVPVRSRAVNLAIGAGISYTEGRFAASVEAPAGANVLFFDGVHVNEGNVITAAAAYGRADAKALEFGELDGPHILVDTVRLALELSARSSLRFELKGIDLSLALADADRFISSISQELKTRFDLAVVWDKAGLRLEGGPKSAGQAPASPPAGPALRALTAAGAGGTTSGGLEASVPPSVTRFGPFAIQQAYVATGRASEDARRTRLELAVSADVKLGPFALTVDRIGMKLDLRAGGVQPNLGLLDLDLAYKAPIGIGVAIDAKVIKGGGSLYLDDAKGEYAGMLELSFKGLTVKAVGLLNTKAPDPAGWSLLLLLYAEFRESPWQIGLGFNITAVGGILGLQHSASVEQLRAALGTNQFDDVLFPADPAENAPRILGRLRTLFPVQANALTVGPVVEVNWGTPALVVARLGILAQFGGAFGGGDFRFTRLTVIGTVRATAPPQKLDSPRLVDLTADVLGDYDVESGLLAIDARLRDSKLGGVDFSGSLIVRIGMGSVPAFAIAAGGFHPAFTDLPPALPARIDRLGLTWKVGSSVVLTLQAYVAITASSWQMGALFTLRAKLGPVDVDGALGFDAIVYDDGRFSVEIGGHVKIHWRGHTLMAVVIKLVMDRNAVQVWHAAGTAKFSILWWDKTVSFEERWGTARSLPPAAPVDAPALLRAALADPGSWATQLPARGDAVVTLVDPKPDPAHPARVMAHPLGALTVTQRVAPLGLRLDHIEGAPVARDTVLAIDGVRIGSATPASTEPTTQVFARARFQDLSEDERLTQKTFERLPAGLAITPQGQAAPAGTLATFDFERVTLAPEEEPRRDKGFPGAVLWHVRRGRAAHADTRRDARLARGAPATQVSVGAPRVAVVDRVDLSDALVLSTTEAASATLAGQRVKAGQLVVEAHEIGV